MFNPETAGPQTTYTLDAACFVCSWWMDNYNGIAVHLNHRDITIVAVSHAPYEKLAAYRKRMGWSFPYLSSVEATSTSITAYRSRPTRRNAGKVTTTTGRPRFRCPRHPASAFF